MFDFLKGVFSFIRKNPTILFSIFLIVFIPLTIFYITFSTIKKFQESIDTILRTNLSLIENVIGNSISDLISQKEILQKKIEKISKENPEISQLRIIVPQEKKFKILASQNPEELGIEIKGEAIDFAFSQKEAIAHLFYDKKNKERIWEVFKSFEDEEGNKIGIVGMAFSLKPIDALSKKAIFSAYAISAIAILLTLFLVLQHTRLFGYLFLAKKLKEIDKAKDEFIRMATHELQSPIVNIKNYILELKEGIKNFLNPEQKEFLSRIEISAKNLSDLIEDILEISRLEQGRLDFTPKVIKGSSIIKEVVSELKLKAEKKGLKLIFEPSRELFFIKVNPFRLREIVFNLVDNAIKYTFFGEVKILTKEDFKKNKYYVIVSDTGIGIPAEAQKRIFEKFFRVKTKETAEIPGTGLGLYICQQLAKRMGGEIFFESIEKVGSKFVLVLPLYKP